MLFVSSNSLAAVATMDPKEQALAASMMAVNTAKSTELFEATSGALQLNEIQNRLDNSSDRVLDAQRLLQNIEAYEVTPQLVESVDANLAAAGVVIPLEEGFEAVQGAESLGRTLLPKNFLYTRLAGCENFLTDFFKTSRDVAIQLGASFKDAWVIFTESQKGLKNSLDLLEQQLAAYPAFISTNTFILEFRLFNLFKIKGKVDGDWPGNLRKLNSTISALSGSYYQNSKNALQTTISYFGGFSSLTEQQAQERILLLPISVPSVPFKECSYPNNRYADSNRVVAKQSVELMGGAYFYDVRLKDRPRIADNADQVADFMTAYLTNDMTGFSNDEDKSWREVGTEIKALSSREISAVIVELRGILNAWETMFEKGEKFKMMDADYNDVIKGLVESELSDDTKSQLAKWFGQVVRKNQMELLMNRVAVSNYLTLIVNGLIQICNNSIKVNAP